MIHKKEVIGGVGSSIFLDFMAELDHELNNLANVLKSFMLLNDNAPAHHGTESWCHGVVSLLFTKKLKYSPNLNTVEMTFSVFKAKLKQKLRLTPPVESMRMVGETFKSLQIANFKNLR